MRNTTINGFLELTARKLAQKRAGDAVRTKRASKQNIVVQQRIFTTFAQNNNIYTHDEWYKSKNASAALSEIVDKCAFHTLSVEPHLLRTDTTMAVWQTPFRLSTPNMRGTPKHSKSTTSLRNYANTTQKDRPWQMDGCSEPARKVRRHLKTLAHIHRWQLVHTQRRISWAVQAYWRCPKVRQKKIDIARAVLTENAQISKVHVQVFARGVSRTQLDEPQVQVRDIASSLTVQLNEARTHHSQMEYHREHFNAIGDALGVKNRTDWYNVSWEDMRSAGVQHAIDMYVSNEIFFHTSRWFWVKWRWIFEEDFGIGLPRKCLGSSSLCVRASPLNTQCERHVQAYAQIFLGR